MIVDEREIPAAQVPAKSAKPRRSHAERRAEGSIRIIDATIQCLDRHGYGGATIDEILRVSGVSRGRLLHLFPAKVDIMLAVCRHTWENHLRYMRKWARQYTSPEERLLDWANLSWKMMSSPNGMAVLEILLACRSDPELASRFVPEHQRIQNEAIAQLKALIDSLNLDREIDAPALHHLAEACIACIRGLAIERALSSERDAPPAALHIWQASIAHFLSARIAPGAIPRES